MDELARVVLRDVYGFGNNAWRSLGQWTGVHFIKHCDSSYFPSVLEASDGQFPTGSNLIYSNDSESFLLN